MGIRCPAGQIRGLWKCSSPVLTNRYLPSLLSWRVWVHSFLWILRLRLRLRAEWQGWKASCKDGGFGIRGTKKIGVWGYGYRFFIDPRYIIFSWFICCGLIYKSTICANLSGSHRAFCRCKFEWTGFFIHSDFSLLDHSATSLTGHSARRACPELQNPHFKNQRKTFTHGHKVSGRVDEGLC